MQLPEQGQKVIQSGKSLCVQAGNLEKGKMEI